MIFFGCTFYGLTARPKEKLQRSVSSHHFCFQGRTASFGSLEGRNISPKKKRLKSISWRSWEISGVLFLISGFLVSSLFCLVREFEMI